jgi:hypothetical protein
MNVCNKVRFYTEELLATCPIPKLKDLPFLAVCDCLFNILAATLYVGGRSSIHNPRTGHAMLKGPIPQKCMKILVINISYYIRAHYFF